MRTETFTCDVCGKARKAKVTGEWGFTMGNYCVVTSAAFPKAISRPDVCQSCFDRIELAMKSLFIALLPASPSIVEPLEKK